MWHSSRMAHKRYKVQVDERGRFVLPVVVRRCLDVRRGGVLVLDVEVDDETVQLRKPADVARSGRGLLRDLARDVDLAAELIQDRRAEAEREDVAELARS
jgi:bifunctional DNA-binding transcriptional regulator/antitoxin component of YhaV-PrlF toxin-antitoxin module